MQVVAMILQVLVAAYEEVHHIPCTIMQRFDPAVALVCRCSRVA